MISSAYRVAARLIAEEFPPSDWNIYPFQFSDGDNWSSEDTATCVNILKQEILPAVNLFCYGQVQSPYGSGQFIGDLKTDFAEPSTLVTAEIGSRDDIPDAIRSFLGKGQ